MNSRNLLCDSPTGHNLESFKIPRWQSVNAADKAAAEMSRIIDAKMAVLMAALKPGPQKPGPQKPDQNPGPQKPDQKPGPQKPDQNPGPQKPDQNPGPQKPEQKPGPQKDGPQKDAEIAALMPSPMPSPMPHSTRDPMHSPMPSPMHSPMPSPMPYSMPSPMPYSMPSPMPYSRRDPIPSPMPFSPHLSDHMRGGMVPPKLTIKEFEMLKNHPINPETYNNPQVEECYENSRDHLNYNTISNTWKAQKKYTL